jgi:hypothetical protein
LPYVVDITFDISGFGLARVSPHFELPPCCCSSDRALCNSAACAYRVIRCLSLSISVYLCLSLSIPVYLHPHRTSWSRDFLDSPGIVLPAAVPAEVSAGRFAAGFRLLTRLIIVLAKPEK